jgi:hypothetical protein
MSMNTETPTPAPSCEHTWEPLQGWYGRYKCSGCQIIGYKQIVTVDSFDELDRVLKTGPRHSTKKVGQIVPYVCHHRTVKKDSATQCKNPAITLDKQRRGVCRDHNK